MNSRDHCTFYANGDHWCAKTPSASRKVEGFTNNNSGSSNVRMKAHFYDDTKGQAVSLKNAPAQAGNTMSFTRNDLTRYMQENKEWGRLNIEASIPQATTKVAPGPLTTGMQIPAKFTGCPLEYGSGVCTLGFYNHNNLFGGNLMKDSDGDYAFAPYRSGKPGDRNATCVPLATAGQSLDINVLTHVSRSLDKHITYIATGCIEAFREVYPYNRFIAGDFEITPQYGPGNIPTGKCTGLGKVMCVYNPPKPPKRP